MADFDKLSDTKGTIIFIHLMIYPIQMIIIIQTITAIQIIMEMQFLLVIKGILLKRRNSIPKKVFKEELYISFIE